MADNGVLDHICAPMDYGAGNDSEDGLNRYWLWDYAGLTGIHTLGLLPRQIVELSVLGKEFNVADFVNQPPATGATPIL